ncbi:dihydrodipicolinate synthase family protein [Terricaulis sp.]|uniref:dihydrodipicolinate synthase family protein n=1 Tax=Terricaulis sp. TaxID=2768686 RepID=UPI00378382E0
MSIAGGAWAAALTPLKDDLSIDFEAAAAHCRWLLANGAAGVVVLGTTGEANSFSLDERKALIAHLARSGLPSARVIVGTGCCSAPETIALTRAALDAGYFNVLMLPPFYYKNVSDDGLFSAYARVIEGVGARALRVLIYDIPPQTGFALSVDLLRRLRNAFPETVVGVKNSSGDWSAMDAALKAMPGFQVFAGSEAFLLATLRAGGPGCISALANVTSTQLGALMEQWRSEGAEALQAAAVARRAALSKFPTIAALKEIMAQRTGRDAWRNIRPPLIPLDAAQRGAVRDIASTLELSL